MGRIGRTSHTLDARMGRRIIAHILQRCMCFASCPFMEVSHGRRYVQYTTHEARHAHCARWLLYSNTQTWGTVQYSTVQLTIQYST